MVRQPQLLRSARQAHRVGNLSERDRLVAESIMALHAASTDADRACCAHSLAAFFRDVGQLVECEKYARLAIDWTKGSGSVSLLGNHLMFLAILLSETGSLGEAVQHAEEALLCYVRANGPDHSEVRYVASVLASLQKQLGVQAAMTHHE